MHSLNNVFSDVMVVSEGRILSSGSYLSRRVFVELDGLNEEFALSIVRVYEESNCEVMPFITETPSTVQLDAPVVIRFNHP